MTVPASKSDTDAELARKLESAPSLLFLGQNYLRLETGVDPLLQNIVRKLELDDLKVDSYSVLFEHEADRLNEPFIAWIDDLCKRLSTPEWLRVVAGVAWSGMLTSAIDAIWPRSFRNDWRDVEPIFEEKYRPADPRNRARLHVLSLFGNVNRSDQHEQIPHNHFELIKRRQVAVGLARRIPELVTPMGTLVIEGYGDSGDWFQPDELWSIVDELGAGQTHIFSSPAEAIHNDFAKHLVREEKLVPHAESLGAFLQRSNDAGRLTLYKEPVDQGFGRQITIEHQTISIDKDIWNQTSRSAIILDDDALLPVASLSPDLRYRGFRRFLGTGEGRPRWDDYTNGFAFSRDFETILRTAVEERLTSKRLADEPIILHGQTGTGKTVALGALALSIRQQRRFPVLFVDRKPQRPVEADVDRFCKWAEDQGAPACLVVWDGMVESGEYSDFLRFLTSRGRKIILVGSSYKVPEVSEIAGNFVEAPAQLNRSEIERFESFLRGFDEQLPEALTGLHQRDDTFLVALYRLLPPSRSQLRSGVARELGQAEQAIARNAASTAEYLPDTSLAIALRRAGLLDDVSVFSADLTEGSTEVQNLTGLIMVPGRFGLSVPFELILRVLGKGAYRNLSRLFRNVDIFRWNEDPNGNISIAPRNALEAQLVVQARFGGARTEVDMATRLLRELRDDQMGSIEGRELRFGVDLLRAMGSQGRETAYFAPFFDELASTLAFLREKRDVRNPRLMLQEANLLREWAVGHAKAGDRDSRDLEALNRAHSVLEEALDELPPGRSARMIRSALTVELATVLASKARYSLDVTKTVGDAKIAFVELKKALDEARQEDPANYYPIDVLAWATRDMLARDVFTPSERLEATADLLYAFQSTDPTEFRADQLERFQSRRLQIGGVLGLDDIKSDAFSALRAQGSTAGYYLEAIRLSGLDQLQSRSARPASKQLSAGLSYLEANYSEVNHDVKCMSLLFDLWWNVKSGSKPFDKERSAVPFAVADWKQCFEYIDTLQATGEAHRMATLDFLKALALFHQGYVEEAVDLFRIVERESDQVRGKRRIIRSYVASTSQGAPSKFHGTVVWSADDRGKGEVYVEELRRRIQFIPSEFGRRDFPAGESLGEFHIAFNFLGPLADPSSYYRP